MKEDTEHCAGDAFDAASGGLHLVRQEQAVEHRQPTPMDLMERAIALGPDAVAVIERLAALQIQMEDRAAKTEYVAAMARLAPKLPIVERNGRVKYEGKDNKPGMDRTYGKYEDIDEAVRPLYTAEGFSVSWKTREGTNGKIRMVGVCSHQMGHFEEFEIDLPHDPSGGKNAIQAIGSTVLGYGRRMLTTMIFNVRIAGVDTDGENLSPITAEQVSHLEKLIKESGTSMAAFEMISGVKTLVEIVGRDYVRCKTALETKLRVKGEKKP